MSFDALTLSAVRDELEPLLSGARLQKVVLPDELIDHNLNQSRGIGGLELKHITFRHEPVTEIDASEQEPAPARRNKLFAARGDEFRLGVTGEGGAKAQEKGHYDNYRCFPFRTHHKLIM